MYTSRRDKKNRKLHNGGIQLADGRYRYKYIDELGKSRYVYSKRLVPNDPAVHGKKEESLREKIARIQKDKQDKIAMSRGDMTVLALVELYISQKIGVKPSTRLGYKTVVNFLKKDPFGKRKISSVKTSDARGWLIDLQKMAEDIVLFIPFEVCCVLHFGLPMKTILLEKIHLILSWQVCL